MQNLREISVHLQLDKHIADENLAEDSLESLLIVCVCVMLSYMYIYIFSENVLNIFLRI